MEDDKPQSMSPEETAPVLASRPVNDAAAEEEDKKEDKGEDSASCWTDEKEGSEKGDLTSHSDQSTAPPSRVLLEEKKEKPHQSISDGMDKHEVTCPPSSLSLNERTATDIAVAEAAPEAPEAPPAMRRIPQERSSRQKRNSLALRKNIPIRFSSGMTGGGHQWSLNSSDIYDITQNVVASLSRQLTDGTTESTQRQEKALAAKKRGTTRQQQQPQRGVLRRTCLNPWLSLRTQLMLSFGFISIILISIVMVVCIVVTILAGQQVNSITSNTFDTMAKQIEGTTVRYIAEFVTFRLIPSDLVQIIWETTRDRMAGYPNAPGYDEDAHVPFFDIESGRNRYPIVVPPLPMDWQVDDYLNVDGQNHLEHVQGRKSWYVLRHEGYDHGVSTETAAYHMQGTCDPNVTDSTHSAFYPGCSDANNNVVTGGVVAPAYTNEQLHRKSGDLAPLLKALYEYHQDVKTLGVGFANNGAGSSVQFPFYTFHSALTYESVGCDWMLKANPLNPARSIGDPEMIARCHPAGTVVAPRDYNPLEQEWCRNQALEPDKVHIEGPHLDGAPDHGHDEYRWVMTVGRAIYDRITSEFVGCIRINVVLDFLEKILKDACVSDNSHITVVRWDDVGTVVASSARNMTNESQTVTIDQLDVGVTEKNYLDLKNLVDYSIPWDSTKLRETYEKTVTTKDGYLIGAYPMPPPPSEYDPNYRPLFLAVKSLSKTDVFDQVYISQDSVEDQVDDLVNLSLFIGLVGILVVLVIIGLVSNRLTSPLIFMNEVATDIVNNYVDNNEEGIEYTLPQYASWCTPKTEISEVVAEFQKMVSRFSGSSNAKAMKGKYTEMRNEFEPFDKFEHLYASRQDKSFKFRLEADSTREEEAEMPISPGAQSTVDRKHTGPLISPKDDLTIDAPALSRSFMKKEPSQRSSGPFSRQKRRFMSPLFTWIVLLIATPLLITTISLSAIVMYRISSEFPELVEDAKADYMSLELFALQVYVGLRADFVSAVTSRSTRDLHLVNRYTSWLLFDGIDRADSFTELATGVEACKMYADPGECPIAQEWPCDCAWHETEQCRNYTSDSRYIQRSFFTCESLDADANGDRKATSYPEVAFSANTTAWWKDVNDLPGSEKGSNASGYGTTYDRLRVLSAVPIFQPLYNYDSEKKYVAGTSVAMEADGSFMGFLGCEGMIFSSIWKSTQDNGAPDTRPELCPEGKHGYDPRCRPWYNTGRNLHQENASPFYLTPPYVYGSNDFGQSATSPIVDPISQEHVGQTLVDFRSTPIFEGLSSGNTPLGDLGYPILITPREDTFGGDAVLGPGFASNGPAPPVDRLVFDQSASRCSDTRCIGKTEFRDAVMKMKRGRVGSARFPKEESDGSRISMFMAYAPVKVKALSVVNSSDFSGGVNAEDHLIYSLAFVLSIEGLMAPFEAIEDDIARQTNTALIILCCAIIISALLVVYISSRVAASITKPMVYLVDLIRHINRMSVDDLSAESPEVNKDYGCREVRHVSTTMEVLHKVVRDANVAFFAGDVETAYAVLTDTLRLFQRLDNKKAIGVGNNNLGNCMLTIYRRMETTKEEEVCGFTKKEIVEKGVSYFHKAIKLGEAAYDEFYDTEGWSPNCLEFMQHLSNRYFNRAMFLLTVKESHKNPSELEELGLRDLQIVRDMDVEIVDEGTQVGWNIRTADQLFEVKLSRIKGHLQLLEMGYPDDWEVDELLDDACKIVRDEREKESSKLFEDLSPAGRMQQIEAELMRYLVYTEDLDSAAKIAIRMLLEDEYTLPGAQMKAVEVLIAYLNETGEDDELKQQVSDYQTWLHAMDEENDMILTAEEGPDTSDMSEVFQLSTARLSTASTLTDLEDLRSRRSQLKESTRGDFTMEIF